MLTYRSYGASFRSQYRIYKHLAPTELTFCAKPPQGFPSNISNKGDVPSTPADLWVWLRAEDRGELFHLARVIERAVSPAFQLVQVIDAFVTAKGSI